jgi:hypothetical protein
MTLHTPDERTWNDIDWLDWERVDLSPDEPPAEIRFPIEMGRLGTILDIWVRPAETMSADCGHAVETHAEVLEHWCLVDSRGRQFDRHYYRYKPEDSADGLLYGSLKDALEGRNGVMVSAALPGLLAGGLALGNRL